MTNWLETNRARFCSMDGAWTEDFKVKRWIPLYNDETWLMFETKDQRIVRLQMKHFVWLEAWKEEEEEKAKADAPPSHV